MSSPEPPRDQVFRRPAPWRKHRLPFLAGGIAVWFAAIAFTHQRAENLARGTSKGAKELLQIGALPVT